MSDWADKVAAAEAGAESKQAAEREAEGRFDEVHARAEALGDPGQALKSAEFHAWMATRHETDEAWGAWATVMDAKPASRD
jgi:hypothetical protein